MKPYVATGGKPTFHEFVTPIGLFAFLDHDKPRGKTDRYDKPELDENGIQKHEYSATLAWDKSRQTELTDMINMALLVKAEAWPESVAPGAFFHLQPVFRDGDNPEHNTKAKEHLFGKYYMSFKQKAVPTLNPHTPVGSPAQVIGWTGGPGILGPNGPGHAIMPIDLYAGCTGRVSGIMFATEYLGKHFISTRLNNIQKYEDGDRIGGGARPTADSQFGALTVPGQGGMAALSGLL